VRFSPSGPGNLLENSRPFPSSRAGRPGAPWRDLRTSALVGVAAGAVEVSCRSGTTAGLSARETAVWLGISGLLCAIYATVVALGAAAVPVTRSRVLGVVTAALVFLEAALWYRFDIVLNDLLYAPRVWGGLLAIAAASSLFGWGMGRWHLRASGRRLDVALTVVTGLAVAVAFWRDAPVRETGPSATGPNILLVTVDTLRRDAVGAYGSAVPTPAFDRLAREGVLFNDAVASAPLTEPSHLGILTGQSPYRSGVVANGTDLGDRPALLSRVLHDAGYATGGFVGGFPLHGRYGWAQGFDVYDDDFGRLPGLHRLSIVKAWDQVRLPSHVLRERTGDLVLDRAKGWLASVRGRRWFAWVHFFDPHAPYEPPAPYRPGRSPETGGAPLLLPAYWPEPLREITDPDWLVEAYHGEVRFSDHLLGQLVDAVDAADAVDARDESRQAAQTIVIALSDHGESLTEHDYLFDHGDDLYDPSLRVPFVLRWPGHLTAGLRVSCEVSTVDVAPTVLDLLGLVSGQPRDGRTLAPLLQGQPCQDDLVVSTTVAARSVPTPPIDHALRTQDRKVIAHGDPSRPPELYDLSLDPEEAHDLFDLLPEEANTMQRGLQGLLSRGGQRVAPAVDAQTAAALRALGYVE
jgi:arylsulfatase A-like enzyme